MLLLNILKQVLNYFCKNFTLDVFHRVLNTLLLFFYMLAKHNRLFILDMFETVLNMPLLLCHCEDVSDTL